MTAPVAVIRLSALGDVAMVTAALREVATEGGGRWMMVTRPPFDQVARACLPDNVEVIVYDPRKESLWPLAKQLKAKGVKRALDLHNVGRTWRLDMLLRLLGIRVTMVGKKRWGRRLALRHKVQVEPFIDRYLKLLRGSGARSVASGVDSSDNFTTTPTYSKLKTQNSELKIGIAPFARYATKTWPMKHVRELVDQLVKQGREVHLFGARGSERAALDALAAEYPDGEVVSEAGRHTFAEELELMATMDAMVAMDSANHHLASLAGVPCVSVWGSTTPACGFMAWGQDPANAVSLGLPCQPCSVAGLATCPRGNLACLRDLTPGPVLARLNQILDTAKEKH